MRDAPADEVTKLGDRLRVLIVDDNHDAADTLAILVEAWGHEARVAYDGTGIGPSSAFEPDVVLLDLGLPWKDGISVARSLRGSDSSTAPLLIAVTGHQDETTRRLAKEAGIDHYLLKPVNPSDIQDLLAKHALTDAAHQSPP